MNIQKISKHTVKYIIDELNKNNSFSSISELLQIDFDKLINDSNESLNTENFIIVKSKSHLVIYSKKLQKLYKLIWWLESNTCEKKWLIYDKGNHIIENINITNLELDETSKIKGNFVLEET